MMEYFLIKWIHIISSTLLFGTGIGTAFFKLMNDRSQNINAIAMTNNTVVLADWLFTTPAIIIQPVSGILLAMTAGYSLNDAWLSTSIILYVLTGVCWIPVVYLQIQMRQESVMALINNTALPESYWKHSRTWFWLGIPAFFLLIIVFYLMVKKPLLFLGV